MLQDSKGVTEVMALLDKFAMKLASDLEKQSSENTSVDIKTNNIGEQGKRLAETFLVL